MVGVYKASIISYFMPIISSLFAFFMPDTNQTFNYIIISIFIFSIIIYPIALFIFKKKKRPNAARFIISFNMLLFCFFFTVPLIKVAIEYVLLQLLLVLFYFLCILLAVIDQKSKNALVLPESGENRKLTYVYFAIPVVAMFLGGGGSIIIVRQMHNVLGDPFMFVWGPIILYIVGCWLTFLFSSLFYKGFTKNGMWIK
ncbi:hypothetical protein [Solibacillus sp. CAU 1738]|uniref:hypothetical protein n=1 Tax=Solibacillus sp. CAU 1738 TaxID=3140363 RepID=UPI003260E131